MLENASCLTSYNPEFNPYKTLEKKVKGKSENGKEKARRGS
jgi:hypothetical protein